MGRAWSPSRTIYGVHTFYYGVSMRCLYFTVITGLVPVTHVGPTLILREANVPRRDVDGRDKPGNDENWGSL